MQRLDGKVALVTGASRGIGACMAQTLAAAGAQVIVNYAASAEAAEQVVIDIEAVGGTAVAIQADVSQPEDARRLVSETIDRFGRLDILVNNAGIATYKRLEDTTDEDFDAIFSVNVKGVFNMLREAAGRLEDGGRIINISSSVTRLFMPAYGSYSATKAAVEQLTRVFAKEVGGRKITVNAVQPGPTHTELFTQGKSEELIQRLAAQAALNDIGSPEQIARVVAFLASDEADWVTAQCIGVNGGFA